MSATQLCEQMVDIEKIPAPVEPVPQCPPVCYEHLKKEYWVQDAFGNWITMNEASLRRMLKAAGFSSYCPENERLSPLERCVMDIQRTCSIAYAGPLAGHRKGITEMSGRKILVTESPTLIAPVKGEWPILHKLLMRMFGEEQFLYFMGWVKIAYSSLSSGELRPGQVLALAGKAGSGKSLAQNLLTEIFGGRSAKPYRYMTGGTDFNRELFGAEHLMIEDEIASTDIRARRHFGARTKDFTVNQTQSCHGKNREALTLTPFWRVSVSLNDEPENLLILPPFDESLCDKFMLLSVREGAMPMPTFSLEDRAKFWKTLKSELPAFLYDLGNWEIPPELRSERYGIKHYHDPELLESLKESTPEARLLALIDFAFKRNHLRETGFEGTAEEFEEQLNLYDYTAAQKLFTWPGAVGTYLGRLAKDFPHRVTARRTNQQRLWHIEPPGKVTP